MIQWNLQSNACDVLSLGPRTAGRLATVGISTVAELLAAQPSLVAQRLKSLSAETLSSWQHEAQLLLALPQLPAQAARIFAAVGFDEAKKINRCTPIELLAALETAQQERPTSWVAQMALPSIKEVTTWIRTVQLSEKSFAA